MMGVNTRFAALPVDKAKAPRQVSQKEEAV